MSILNALRRLESGYRQSANVELAKMRLLESQRQFDIQQEFKEKELAAREDLTQLNEDLKRTQLENLKLDRFIKGIEILQSGVKQKQAMETQDLALTFSKLKPIKTYLDNPDGKRAGSNAEKALVNMNFNEEEAKMVVNFMGLNYLAQNNPEYKPKLVEAGLSIANLMNQQLSLDKIPDGIVAGLLEEGIFTDANSDAYKQKYSSYVDTQNQLNELSKDIKDAYLRKEYNLDAREMTLPTDDIVKDSIRQNIQR
tara:strand:+ start:542 stop:1303 length:762 start_codon:yes stop_codon:yes gene_type:complete